jgi:hypothetical protein
MTKRSLWLLVALLVAARAALVLACADVFFYGEELAKGTAAKAMIDHLPVAHYQKNLAYHEGGGFVVTHLKALAFLLVGESLLAHKLVAIALTALLLVIGVVFVRETFGDRAARIFGFLFVLCPDSYLRFSLLDLGTHFEALIFIALILRYAYRVLRANGEDLADWAKLGLASGFGIYFSLQCAPAIACAALYLVLGLRARVFCRGLALATLTTLIGVSPLLMMLKLVGNAAIRVRGQDVISHSGTGIWQSISDIAIALDAVGWMWVVSFVALIALGFARHRSRDIVLPALGLVGYMALFSALYLFSGLAVGTAGHWFIFLRSSALWFFGTILVAAFLGRETSGWLSKAHCALTVLGVIAFVSVLRTGRPAHPFENARIVATTKGVNYAEYFDYFKDHLELSTPDKIRLMMKFKDDSDLLPSGIAHALFDKSDLPLAQVLEITKTSFFPRTTDALLGLGHYLHPDQGYDVPAAFREIESAPEELRPVLAEAIGRTGIGPRLRLDRIALQLEIAVPPQYRDAYVRGAGWRVYFACRLNPDTARAFIAEQPEADRAALTAGCEAARASNTLR